MTILMLCILYPAIMTCIIGTKEMSKVWSGHDISLEFIFVTIGLLAVMLLLPRGW